MSARGARRVAAHRATQVTAELGGRGIFGVELFVAGDEVWFSEVSPRPHDTGLVTLISQDLSEFALHARAILGLPIPAIRQRGPCGFVRAARRRQLEQRALRERRARADRARHGDLRLFGKPEVRGTGAWACHSRLGSTSTRRGQKARKMTALLSEGVRCE